MIGSYYGPAHELNRRLIEVLRSDPQLGGLLFPAWSPTPVTPDDTRIYNAHVAIDDPKLLQILPRVIVECQQDIFDVEQPNPKSGPVNVWFHCIVPKDQYDHAEAMDLRIRTIIASTYLTSSRIIASGLNEIAPRRRTVETAFYDAWRITSAFQAPNVGVLAT
jgi:hypothetical protein